MLRSEDRIGLLELVVRELVSGDLGLWFVLKVFYCLYII